MFQKRNKNRKNTKESVNRSSSTACSADVRLGEASGGTEAHQDEPGDRGGSYSYHSTACLQRSYLYFYGGYRNFTNLGAVASLPCNRLVHSISLLHVCALNRLLYCGTLLFLDICLKRVL